MKHRLLDAWRKSRFDAELEAELQFHLEELIAGNKAAGMNEREARGAALLKLGSPGRVKERCREALWTRPFDDAARDAKFAVRSLRKAGGLNLMTALALALGIGCSSIVFSVVYNGVLHPFPYRGAERLMALRIDDRRASANGFRSEFRLDEIAAFRSESHSFEDVVGYGNWYVTYVHDHRAEVLHGGALTPNAMQFFGVRPLFGRTLSEEDSRVGAVPVVLLNYRFWKEKFHEETAVLGTQMILDGRFRTVAGVMPPRFQVLGADVWLPIGWNTNRVFEEREPRFFWATAILKPGVRREAAEADLNVAARRLAQVYPRDYPKQLRAVLRPLGDAVVADFRRILLLLTAAVAILLLLSCSNGASLLLVRASARVKEMATRRALGASRGRLIRQSLAETLVLAAGGCAAGCGIAFVGLKVAANALLAPFAQIPWEASISLDWPTVLFAVAASLASSLLVGLAPAMYAAAGSVQPQLGGSGVGVNASFAGTGFRSALVVCQVGLSVVLLISAGLTVRSFFRLTHADLGLRARNVFEARIHFPRSKYRSAEEKRRYVDQLLAKLALIPGVTHVAESIGRPVDGGPVSDVTIPGKPHSETWDTMIEACSEGYFSTLGLQLLHGKLLSADDVQTGRFVAVVNETLARRYFGHEEPLGRQIRFNALDDMPEMPHNAYFEIVGVVSDFRNRGVSLSPMPEAFVPHSFTGFGDRGILVRTAVTPSAIGERAERILWDADPEVVLGEASTLEEFLNQNVYAKPRFLLIALGVCAGVGLALAVIGTFSVMAYSVSLRTHEIGIRLAVGAGRSTVLVEVLGRGMKLVGTGMLLGFGAAVMVVPAAERALGNSSFDMLTVVISAAVLAAAGLGACYWPALRATRVDTSIALRYE